MSSQDAAARVAVSLHRRVRLGLRLPANRLQLGALGLLVAAGVPALAAQTLAIAVATPVNFLGTKLWSFGP